MVEPAPHEPHRLPPEEEHNEVPVPPLNAPIPPSSSSKNVVPDKENSRPVQDPKKSQKLQSDAER